MAARRGVQLVLMLIALGAIVSAVSVFLIFSLVARGPDVPSTATLVLRPGGELPETDRADVVAQLLQREPGTLRTFLDGLRNARRDPRIEAVLLRPGTLDLPYWGKVQELRDAVLDFRESGKQVVAFLEFGGEREYYLASAADRVFLMPTSPLDLTGVASYAIFLRGAFDHLGMVPDFLAIGDYKSAPEQYTETGYTEASREMAESLNREMYEQLVTGIAESRGKTVAEVQALLDRGPLGPEEALAAGLVDGLAYADELDQHVPELGEDDPDRRISGGTYSGVSPGSIGFGSGPRIAVLYAVGTIVSGRSGFDVLNGTVLGSDSMVEQIRRIEEDDSIRAVVLRIDSPGGSSVASDVIWRALTQMRDERPDRPLVVSMSDLAASGGYYIATSADAIVAQPGTLTGSIGVFMGKIALGGALDKIGVSTETISSGANAEIYSPFEPFTPGQRERLEAYMRTFYDNFVTKVADARGSTPEAIEAVAQGRVWTGRQALEHGLVDALGGLDVAVAMAKERAGIAADADVALVNFPAQPGLLEALATQFGTVGAEGLVARLLGGDAERRAVATLTAPARLFRRGEPLALMPFAFVR